VIFLYIQNVEHFFMCLLAICTFPFGKIVCSVHLPIYSVGC
jgi:hypothetical protein